MTDGDRVVSHGKGFRANKILLGMHRDISTLEVRAKLADLGLAAVEHSIRLETQFFCVLFLVTNTLCSMHVCHTPK